MARFELHEFAMTTESLPRFTTPATKLWATIPNHTKNLLLSNVWCGKCRHEVTITNFSGVIKSGNLLLVGVCSECRGDVARVIDQSCSTPSVLRGQPIGTSRVS